MIALTTLTFSALSWAALGRSLANHLWQSTVFAVVVWFLTLLLRRNRAETRYSLWLVASAKFLLPFSLLIGLGSHIAWPKAPATPPSLFVVTHVLSEPFDTGDPAPVAHASDSHLAALLRSLPTLLLMVWSSGCAAVVFLWWRRRQRTVGARRGALAVRTGRELETLRRLEQSAGMTRPIDLKISQSALEPGILGIFHPALLLPPGISDRLSDAQLEAIITHELCHVRRRDNVAATLHMLVEAVFWFHPLIWWIGARLVEERERACDEEVLKLGSDPQAYAEGILKVCEFYVESSLFCAAGVTGSNLKKRIEAIMIHRSARELDLGRKLLLAATSVVMVLGPIGMGFAKPGAGRGQSQPTPAAPPSFQDVSIKPTKSAPTDMTSLFVKRENEMRVLTATNESVKKLIAEAYGLYEFQVSGGPDWISVERYDITAKMLDSGSRGQVGPAFKKLITDRFRLTFHREAKVLPVYELVVSKNGSKLSPVTSSKESAMQGHMSESPAGHLVAHELPIRSLAQILAGDTNRIVLDKTGLQGSYDFTLDWIPGSPTSLLTAISEQLGLELREQTGPVEMFIIDHAEKITGDEASSSQSQPKTQNVADSRAAFETISIKPNKTGDIARATVFKPDGFMARNASLHALIAAAYEVEGSEILGGPDWVHSENYDVEAKLATSVIDELNKGQYQRLLEQKRILQALLADRFRLTLHRETREPPAYVLAIAKDGFKLQEAKARDTYPDGFKDPQGRPLGAGVLFQPGACKLVGQGVHLVDLAKTLSVNYLGGQTVIDQTGLSGVYDFTVDCNTAFMERGESVLTVLPEQLGLEVKLLDVLVIDSAEKPSEN